MADELSQMRHSRQVLRRWRDALKDRMRQRLRKAIQTQLEDEEEERLQLVARKYAQR